MGIYRQDLHIKASIENTETIKRLVSGGVGISILSKLAVKDKLTSGEILGIPLEKEGGKRNIHLVYNKNFQLSNPAKDFMELVKKVYKADKCLCTSGEI